MKYVYILLICLILFYILSRFFEKYYSQENFDPSLVPVSSIITLAKVAQKIVDGNGTLTNPANLNIGTTSARGNLLVTGNSTTNGNSTNNTINNELKSAKLWYEEFSSKFPNADVYEHILRFQLQDYIMDFPVMVYDHISHFPTLSFEKKLELMCSSNFSACRIFLSSLWNHKKISPCTDTDPHGVIHFHASWQQPLYKKVLNKADETSFGIKLMDAYQKPIYKLMDHYNFWILMDAVEFPI